MKFLNENVYRKNKNKTRYNFLLINLFDFS